MDIIGHGMTGKFGRNAEGELLGSGRSASSRYFTADDWTSVVDRVEVLRDTAVLLLYHGHYGPSSKSFRDLHNKHAGLHTLFIGTNSMDHHVANSELPRAVGLAVGVDNLQAWDRHPKAVRKRLEALVRHAADSNVDAPDWTLIEFPSVPEHLIACYLADLAGKPELVQRDWRRPFEDEVDWLRREHEMNGQLTWNDRTDANKIGAFLREAQAVVD